MKILFLLLILITTNLEAADIWNTYQWNKKNEAQGNGEISKTPWYEWWYYKVVIPETGKSYFFVYGIVNPWDTNYTQKGTRAYVSAGDFSKKIMTENKYSLDKFHASYLTTDIVIDNNTATDTYLQGSSKNPNGQNISWNFNIEKKWSFNAEGWMMGTMLTDIEWYPAQADATCSGEINSNGEVIQFKNAPCYQDRNWGKSFPGWWAWIVSNYFEGYPDTTIAIGGGNPKVRGQNNPYASVSIGLKHLGKEYSFRPIDLNYVNTDIKYGKWEVSAVSNGYKIEVKAWAPKEKFLDLQFVTPGGEVFHDYETLTGEMEVNLYKKNGSSFAPLYHLVSHFAGIEYGSLKTYESFQLNSNLLMLGR